MTFRCKACNRLLSNPELDRGVCRECHEAIREYNIDFLYEEEDLDDLDLRDDMDIILQQFDIFECENDGDVDFEDIDIWV